MFGVYRARQSGMIFLFSKGIFEIMYNIQRWIHGFQFPRDIPLFLLLFKTV